MARRFERRAIRHLRDWKGYLWAIVAAALGTAIASGCLRKLELTDAIMIYLLAVVAIATRVGLGPSLFSALVGGIAFDYFVIPPVRHFSVVDVQHLVTLGGMIVVAVIVSGLTERLRLERARAMRSEQRTSALYALERDLVGARTIEALALVAVRHLANVVDATLTVFVRAAEQDMRAFALTGEQGEPLSREVAMAERVIASKKAVWPSYRRLEVAGVPLAVPDRIIGAVTLRPARAGAFGAPERELVEACGHQLANAIDRLALADGAEKARLEIETERVRNAVLSSVSHDLRTPLAMISASAQILVRNHAQMAPSLRGELLAGVADQADRLDDLLRNLAAMTRVEAGKLGLRTEPGAIHEVVSTAVRRCSRSLGGRRADLHAPRGLPLVTMDASLMEQVFVNILENAARYSPPGTPIDMSIAEEGDDIVVEVKDSGPGVPEDELEKIFDKFYRGRNAPRSDGHLGLGLAICRAIVGAHGGTIGLRNAASGGAVVHIALPAAPVSLTEAALRLPELS